MFIRLAPNADDIYFWTMAILNKTKIKISANAINTLTYTTPEREYCLYDEKTLANDNCIKEANDIQLKRIIEYYPEIINKLTRE